MPDSPDTEGRREPDEAARVAERARNEAASNPDGVPKGDKGYDPTVKRN